MGEGGGEGGGGGSIDDEVTTMEAPGAGAPYVF